MSSAFLITFPFSSLRVIRGFKSVLFDCDLQSTTDFEENNKFQLYYILAVILGGIVGVVYVLIANAFKNRRTLLTNS